MNAGQGQMDHVGRTCLAMSCGSRDDSLSWNLSRVKQGSAIRADDIDDRVEGRCNVIASREEGDERDKTAVSTRAMSESAAGKTGVEKPFKKAVAGASQEVRIAKGTKPAAEQSTALKADAAVQFKVGKTMTERALRMQVSKR